MESNSPSLHQTQGDSIPADAQSNLGAHKITDIIYMPNGKVLLEFELEGLSVSAEQQAEVLSRAGFREVGDGVPADE